MMKKVLCPFLKLFICNYNNSAWAGKWQIAKVQTAVGKMGWEGVNENEKMAVLM